MTDRKLRNALLRKGFDVPILQIELWAHRDKHRHPFKRDSVEAWLRNDEGRGQSKGRPALFPEWLTRWRVKETRTLPPPRLGPTSEQLMNADSTVLRVQKNSEL